MSGRRHITAFVFKNAIQKTERVYDQMPGRMILIKRTTRMQCRAEKANALRCVLKSAELIRLKRLET
jgi:hypothetical protein